MPTALLNPCHITNYFVAFVGGAVRFLFFSNVEFIYFRLTVNFVSDHLENFKAANSKQLDPSMMKRRVFIQ